MEEIIILEKVLFLLVEKVGSGKKISCKKVIIIVKGIKKIIFKKVSVIGMVKKIIIKCIIWKKVVSLDQFSEVG